MTTKPPIWIRHRWLRHFRLPLLALAWVLDLPRVLLLGARNLAARVGDTSGRVRELEADHQRLEGIIAGDPSAIKMEMNRVRGGEAVEVNAEMRHPLAAIIIESFAEMLDVKGAINFVTFELYSPRHGRIEVTVRRANGKTPAVVMAELKAKIAELEAHKTP